jgi:tetratricopeptide (TPR) repeat protein
VLGDRRGADQIRRGYELARNDPSTSHIAAQLAADTGDWPAAVERFRRAIKIRGATADEVVRLLVERYHQPDVALQLAADDEPAMRTLVALLEHDNAAPDVLATARAADLSLLRAAADRDDASADVLARIAQICADAHDYDAAVKYYRRALTMDYGAVELRLDLARALANQGHPDLALHEAETCLRQRPDWPKAEQFVKQLQLQRP